MEIELNIDEVSDDLYNMLLMELLTKAATDGMDLVKSTKVINWKISAEVVLPNKVHKEIICQRIAICSKQH